MTDIGKRTGQQALRRLDRLRRAKELISGEEFGQEMLHCLVLTDEVFWRQVIQSLTAVELTHLSKYINDYVVISCDYAPRVSPFLVNLNDVDTMNKLKKELRPKYVRLERAVQDVLSSQQ